MSFRVPDRPDLPVTGYPRNDALFREFPGERVGQGEKVREDIKGIDAERVVVYLPTYREDGTDPAAHVDFAVWIGSSPSVTPRWS